MRRRPSVRWLPCLLLLSWLAVPRTASGDGAAEGATWSELVRATAATFARPGSLPAKRGLVDALVATGRDDAWVLVLAALEQEGRHLDDLTQARAAAWARARSLWSRPRRQHHAAHAARLRQAFDALGAADRRWFREHMLVGQLSARLRGADGAAGVLLRREATAPIPRLHPIARAAVAPLLVAELDAPEGVARYRTLLERDPDANVRLAALAALPEGGRAVEPLLMRRLRDRSWVVRIAAARRLAERGLAGAAPQLEDALQRAGPREALVHVRALRELGATPRRLPPAGPVRLYGAPVPSRHVVFVLDASAAMAGHIARAKRELAAAIRALPEDGTFGLVAFHGAVLPFRSEVVRASPENKRDAIAWLGRLEAGWNACLDGALREAFRIAHLAPPVGADSPIDTIVVVGAGRPQAYAPGEAAPIRDGYLERLVGVWNRDRRIRIQAVALADGPARTVLEHLARDNDGALTTP